MNLQDLVTLEKSFEGIVFSEKDHSYLINNELATYSVTQILKKYDKPFESRKMASIVAKRQGVLVEDILNLWEFKKEFACLKGTLFHLYVENFLQKKKNPLDKTSIHNFIRKYPDYVSEDVFYGDMARYISNFLEFYEGWKEDHILVRPELVVGDKVTKICGCIDNLSYNFKTGELVIFDYKSNKEIKDEGKEYLLGLLGHLKSCNLVKYSLQLNLYSAIIERNTPFKINGSKIVWVGGESLEQINCLDLKNEALSILASVEKEKLG
jgi:hypothetical protein